MSSFLSLDTNQKIETLTKTGACFCCLKKGHLSRQCLNKKSCNTVQNGQPCNRLHHPMLHQVYADGSLFHISINTLSRLRRKDNIILMVSSIPCNGQSLTTFWDPGSDTSLITRRAANRLGLRGKPVTLTITKAGNERTTTESQGIYHFIN